jgi:DNA-binding NarL/FixJ family response regulator
MSASRIFKGRVPGKRVTPIGDNLVLVSVPIAETLESPDARVLTPSESAVAALAARGFSNADIAKRRRCSPRTVAHQLAEAYRKLNVRGTRELRARFGS